MSSRGSIRDKGSGKFVSYVCKKWIKELMKRCAQSLTGSPETSHDITRQRTPAVKRWMSETEHLSLTSSLLVDNKTQEDSRNFALKLPSFLFYLSSYEEKFYFYRSVDYYCFFISSLTPSSNSERGSSKIECKIKKTRAKKESPFNNILHVWCLSDLSVYYVQNYPRWFSYLRHFAKRE